MFKFFGNSKLGEVTDLVRMAIASASLAKGQPESFVRKLFE